MKIDKTSLKWAMKAALVEQCMSSSVITESKMVTAKKFILEEATYEQLMNLVYNPVRDKRYLSSSVLENVAVSSINMITENSVLTSQDKVELLESILNEGDWKTNWNRAVGDVKAGVKDPRKAAGYIGDKAKEQGERTIKNAKRIGRDIRSAGGTAVTAIKSAATNSKVQAGLAIGATAIALATGAYYLYKTKFSAAAKACAGKPDPAACRKQFKIAAIKSTIAQLKKAASGCSKDKNPQKCTQKYQRQIAKWTAKLQKASN